MGDALELVVGGPKHGHAIVFGSSATLVLQVFMPYQRYVGYLKWLTLALLAYVAVLFTVSVPWPDVLRGIVWPSHALDRDALTTIVAVLGTTISPYLFFWQAAQEVEEIRAGERAATAP